MTGCSNGLNAGQESSRNGMVGTTLPMSAAVMTACTPGRVSAAVLSIERMRPCATGLRRITACRRPSRARSSTNWPRPRRKRKSSRRSTGLPMKALVVRFASMSDVLRFAHRDVAQRARGEQLLELDAAVGQPVLVGILQQRLDRRPVRLDAVGKPVLADDRFLLLDQGLEPGRRDLGRAHV